MEKVVEKKAQVQGNANVAAKDAAKDAEFKAKKNAAAKAFAERQKAKKEALVKAAQEIVARKDFNTLSAETQKFIQDVLNPAKGGSSGGSTFFNKVFGATPKVGDSVKLIDYMQKTLDGKTKLDKYVKEWAEKGIVVEVTPNAKIGDTLYTIKKM